MHMWLLSLLTMIKHPCNIHTTDWNFGMHEKKSFYAKIMITQQIILYNLFKFFMQVIQPKNLVRSTNHMHYMKEPTN
jgi:hypothetical protein